MPAGISGPGLRKTGTAAGRRPAMAARMTGKTPTRQFPVRPASPDTGGGRRRNGSPSSGNRSHLPQAHRPCSRALHDMSAHPVPGPVLFRRRRPGGACIRRGPGRPACPHISGRPGVKSPTGPVDEGAAGPARPAAARTGPGRSFGDDGPFSHPGETPVIAEPPLPMPRHGEDRAREPRLRGKRNCSARAC